MPLDAMLGWIATFLFTICYVPQIIKTARTQTVDGLSFWLLFISLVANIIALVYATLIGQMPLIIKYIGGIIFISACLYLYWRVASRTRVARSAPAEIAPPIVEN